MSVPGKSAQHPQSAQAISKDTGPGDGTLVLEHFVPTPRTVSPEAQEILRRPYPVAQPAIPTSSFDEAAWRAVRAGDDGIAQMASGYVDQYPANIITHRLSCCTLWEVVPLDLMAENAQKAILYVHGGGFVMGGGTAARYLGIQMAGLAQVRTFVVDYRMPPEFGFPTPLDDIVEAYRHILKDYEPTNIAFYGGSAGANLAAAAILLSRDLGLSLPAACALHSPVSDLHDMGDTHYTSRGLTGGGGSAGIALKAFNLFYANGHDPKSPLISPVYADYSLGFPPTILTAGTRDHLLSCTVRLHRSMRRAGVMADLHVWEGMPHTGFHNAPEGNELMDEHVHFILGHI